MTKWVFKGLKSGVKTTPYPRSAEMASGVSPGLPVGKKLEPERDLSACAAGALSEVDGETAVDYGRCVHCFRCARGSAPTVGWRHGYEWGALATETKDAAKGLGKAFARSIHIRVVDAGACGACLAELKQLTKPYYNIHRLGFFITPTPRQADVLLIVGPVTDNMRLALQKTYQAIPAPKAVLAVGACAISGGVFGRSFACEGGASELVPVNVRVPGCPPPPLAVLHGLLVTTGRKPSATRNAPESRKGRNTA